MTAHFRLPPIRAPKILAHAKGQRCTLRLQGICCNDPETTVFSHFRDRHKGMGQKASDHSGCFACWTCHAYLDTGALPAGFVGVPPSELDMARAMLRAIQETMEVLIRDRVIDFPVVEEKLTQKKPRTKPRRKPDDRQKIAGRLQWPKGRKLPSRKTLQKGD